MSVPDEICLAAVLLPGHVGCKRAKREDVVCLEEMEGVLFGDASACEDLFLYSGKHESL